MTEVTTQPSLIPDSPARRLRDALEPLAAQGFYAARIPLEALGLGLLSGYVWSRASSLGEPAAAVVVATFGVFEPAALTRAYDEGRAAAARSEVVAARTAGAAANLEAALGDDEAVVAELADTLLGAADAVSGTGRALFSGLRALEAPPTPYGKLWRGADLFREHRGDGHLAASIAAGLDPVEMNVLTELFVGYPLGAYAPSRGHSAEAIAAAVARLRDRGLLDGDALSAAGATVRTDVERATDTAQAELMAALGDDLDDVVAKAAALSERLVAAGGFAVDGRKRAAG